MPTVTMGEPEVQPAHRRWRRRPDVAWRTTLRGVVIFAPAAPAPVTIVGSGQEVWSLLERPHSLDELVAALSERYPAPETTIRADVSALLGQLSRLGALDELVDPRGEG